MSQRRDIESQKPGLRMFFKGPGFLHICALDRCLPEIWGNIELPVGRFPGEPQISLWNQPGDLYRVKFAYKGLKGSRNSYTSSPRIFQVTGLCHKAVGVNVLVMRLVTELEES